jgi:FixJ family two-component response regulator
MSHGPSNNEIIIVDDDPAVRDALSVVLTLEDITSPATATGSRC